MPTDCYDAAGSVLKSPAGPRSAAYFDLDHTLLGGWSVLPLACDVARTATLAPSFRPGVARALLQAAAEDEWNADPSARAFAAALRLAARALAGRRAEWLQELGEQNYRDELAALVYPEMRELIRLHRARGHQVVLASAATRFQVAPVARDLRVDHILCSELETRGGRFTGALSAQPCWGVSKLARARSFADEHGVDLARSFFYSDGIEDVPLLEAVGHPVATNPGDALCERARQRGWPVLRLAPRQRPGLRRRVERFFEIDSRSARASWLG